MHTHITLRWCFLVRRAPKRATFGSLPDSNSHDSRNVGPYFWADAHRRGGKVSHSDKLQNRRHGCLHIFFLANLLRCNTKTTLEEKRQQKNVFCTLWSLMMFTQKLWNASIEKIPDAGAKRHLLRSFAKRAKSLDQKYTFWEDPSISTICKTPPDSRTDGNRRKNFQNVTTKTIWC